MNFRGWQLGHGLIMYHNIRDLRGDFLWLPCKQKGKISFRKNKIVSSSVTIQGYQQSREMSPVSTSRDTQRTRMREKSSKEEERSNPPARYLIQHWHFIFRLSEGAHP